MAADAQRLGPLSWQQDRAGGYQPGVGLALFAEQIRLGYLRIRLNREGYVTPESLEAMLRCSPRRLLPNKAAKSLTPFLPAG
jgi:hypothetical protein